MNDQSRTPRELLTAADGERRVARGAEDARRRIRLQQTPVAHKRSGLFGWARDRSKKPDPATFEALPPGVVTALYDALGIVMREANLRADELERKVTTREDHR